MVCVKVSVPTARDAVTLPSRPTDGGTGPDWQITDGGDEQTETGPIVVGGIVWKTPTFVTTELVMSVVETSTPIAGVKPMGPWCGVEMDCGPSTCVEPMQTAEAVAQTAGIVSLGVENGPCEGIGGVSGMDAWFTHRVRVGSHAETGGVDWAGTAGVEPMLSEGTTVGLEQTARVHVAGALTAGVVTDWAGTSGVERAGTPVPTCWLGTLVEGESSDVIW